MLMIFGEEKSAPVRGAIEKKQEVHVDGFMTRLRSVCIMIVVANEVSTSRGMWIAKVFE